MSNIILTPSNVETEINTALVMSTSENVIDKEVILTSIDLSNTSSNLLVVPSTQTFFAPKTTIDNPNEYGLIRYADVNTEVDDHNNDDTSHPDIRLMAETAEINSETAVATANNAESVALGIDAKASEALSNSETAVETADEAKAIALGVEQAKVFDTFEDMETWLKDEANKGLHTTGLELLIKSDDVPDYWVTAVLETPNANGYYYDIEENESSVYSVNGEKGAVVLDSDDISDTDKTHKFATAEQLAQIAINSGDIEFDREFLAKLEDPENYAFLVKDAGLNTTTFDLTFNITNWIYQRATIYRSDGTKEVVSASSNGSYTSSYTFPKNDFYWVVVSFGLLYPEITEISGAECYKARISNKVTKLPDNFFTIESKLTDVIIPNSITTIEGWAFFNCTSLSSITIPNSITTIENDVFAGCSSLTSIIIPHNVTTIGSYAFSVCPNLTKVKFSSLTPPIVGSSVFSNSGITATTGFIYAPAESLDLYKSATNLTVYADRIFPIIEGEYLKDEFDSKEPLLPEVPDSQENKYLSWDGLGNKIWKEISVGTSGYSGNIYLTDTPSTINSAYNQLSYDWQSTESVKSIAVTNSEILYKTYMFDYPIGVTLIDSGTWNASSYAYVSSNSGITRVRLEVFTRTTGGVETILFSEISEDINALTSTYITLKSTQPNFTVNATDYLGFRMYVSTDSAAEKILYFNVGGQYSAYINTPIALRHNQLRDLNGDSNFLHITQGTQTFGGVKIFEDNINIGTVDADANLNIKGDLNIAGDIIQAGSTYETHAEQIYTTKDEIILREGAVAGLATGALAKITAKLYDGTNDGVLGFDNNGFAKVGDVGSEQIIATREDTPLDKGVARWDATTFKFVTETPDTTPTASSTKLAESGGIKTALDAKVDLTSAQTIDGSKTFTENILGNIAGNSDSSTYCSRLKGTDTRDDNQTPEWYYTGQSVNSRTFLSEFKKASVLGLSGSEYCLLLTIVPWGDATGGLPSQTAYMSNGKKYARYATSTTTWSAWEKEATTQSYTATLSASDWTGTSAPYSKEVTVSGILATDKPDFDLNLSSASYANIPTIQSAWFNVYRTVASADTITFYSYEKPSIDLPLTIKVVR